MTEFLVPIICAVFGAICARYVTALGLLLSAIATFAVLLAFNALAGGVYAVGSLGAAFVSIQIGYFLGVIGATFAGRLSSIASSKAMRTGGLKSDHD